MISHLLHWGLQAPPPMFISSLWSAGGGERCIDRTSCTSGVQWEGYSNPFLVFPSKSISPSGPQSLLVCLATFQLLARIWSSPYDCRLRVNFHCWLRLWLQISTVSPPILALRLSRQRLLPTWRSLELDSICSHFWRHTMIHSNKNKKIFGDSSSAGVHETLLAPIRFSQCC